MKISLITNIPAPYRTPVYDKAAEILGDCFNVIYCARKEPNRPWTLPKLNHPHQFLKENIRTRKGVFIHTNLDIFPALTRLNPDIVITCGFNPTHLYAFCWAVCHRKKHIPMTDGTAISESGLTWKHHLVRNVVFRASSAFIGASLGSRELYRSYRIPEHRIFTSCLCIDNQAFSPQSPTEKKYDLMFSGQFIDRKLPFFFVAVCQKLLAFKPDLRVLLMGSGPRQEEVLNALSNLKISFDFPGYVEQHRLPGFYQDSRLLLFPTQCDPWGIVANEACAAGTPVLTCSNAGVAGDLILDGINGFVLPLDPDYWVKNILALLTNPDVYVQISKNATDRVQKYNFETAATGLLKACETAYKT